MINKEHSPDEFFRESNHLPTPEHHHLILQAVIVTDLEGKIIFWNKAATELYGWTSEEALGKYVIDLIPSQQTKLQAEESMKNLMGGQSWSGEFIVQRKNGTYFPASVIDLPYYKDQDTLWGIIGISTDLTEQKKSDRELRLLLNNTKQSFILLDLSLTVTSFNNQAAELYRKYKHEELIKGSPILEFADSSRINMLKENYGHVLEGNIQESELTFTNEVGGEDTFALKYIPAKDESENIIGICISAKNITEQKKAAATLVANEAKWHALIENIHDIFMVLDKEGCVKYISPSIKKVLDFAPPVFANKNFFTLFHAEDADTIKQCFANSLEQPGIQQPECQARIKNKQGEWIWLEGNLINLLDNKNIEAVVYTSRDVTELVKGSTKVKEEQENKEALINATNDHIWSINSAYELIAANTAFINKFKRSTGIDLKPGDSLMPEDKFSREWLALWKSLYSRAFKGESFSQEIDKYTPGTDQEESWTEIKFNPIWRNDKVIGISCLSQDITERKKKEKAEGEAAINQSLFSAIISASDDAIISKDLEGKVTSWNKGAEKIFGYRADEIIGKSITAIIPPELIEDEAYILKQIKEKKPVPTYETERIDKYGNRKLVSLSIAPIKDIGGNVIGASKISRDISKQKRDAIALQQNEARLQGIMDSQTNYIIRTDLEGRYTYYNEKFYNDFHWATDKESVLGTPSLDSIMPYHHIAVKVNVAKCISEPNKVFQLELDKPMANGSIKTTFWDFICLTDQEGNPAEIQCIGIDITDRVNAEKQLKQSLNEKNAILESIGDAFFAVDKNGITTYWNKNAEAMLGVAKETILHKNIWEILPELKKTENYTHFNSAIAKNEATHYELYNPANDHWFEVNMYPSEHGLSVYFKDITNRKKAEELILKAYERFNFVSRATSDVIWDWNINTGTVQRSKDNMGKVFGYNPIHQINSHEFWRSKIHPDDAAFVDQQFQDAFKNKNESFLECEYRLQRADGSYAYVFDKGYILRTAAGEPYRMIGAMKDISKLKLNEILLQQKAEDLIISNKELEHFAFVASHDLQEPLRMVTSFLTQLKKNYESSLDERANTYIKFAVDGAVRMRQIILDLLEYSRVGRINHEVENVNLNEILEEIILLAHKSIEELGATIIYKDLPVLLTHKSPIRQLFQNLVSNALKFSQPDRPPVIKITAEESPSEWTFTVRDNGIGIGKEYFDKIFILFQRLHNREDYAGSGIGLSVAKKIVETMGGKIWIESREGEGTSFFFTLKKN